MTISTTPIIRERLEYLDSIRGLAALYVVVGHVLVGMQIDLLPRSLQNVSWFIAHGELAVSLFIVLSGYCLALPVAKVGGFSLVNGFSNYMLRRARRIYPPYVAAMSVSLLVLAALPAHVIKRSFWMTTFTPAFTWQNLASHALLVHNLDSRWLYKINAPFWSVATEWQIYFFMPALLYAASRLKWIATIVICVFASLLPIFIFRRFETAAPWFIALFAMGMAAAYSTHLPGTYQHAGRICLRWGMISIVFATVTVAVLCNPLRANFGWKENCLVSIVWGLAVAAFLIWVYSPAKLATHVRSLLHTKPLLRLGTISYSLYLTHAIALTCSEIALSYLAPNLSLVERWWMRMIFGTISSILLAAAFYFPFERPFLNVRRRKGCGDHRVPPTCEVQVLAVAPTCNRSL